MKATIQFFRQDFHLNLFVQSGLTMLGFIVLVALLA